MAAPAPILRHHAQFHSVHLPDDRDVVVYLPPGYEDTDLCHPVLYMQDGQNLFEAETAFQEVHWRLGETADALIAEGVLEPLIIVGVANTGKRRIEEYTPTRDKKLGGGLGDRYGRLLVEELKPFIDATYRTRTDRASTALGGSSLGGLVTLYLGMAYPDIFGSLAVMSPSVWWDRRVILKSVRRWRPTPPVRLWVDMGTAEGRRGLDDARMLKAALVGSGWVVGKDLRYAEYEGGVHGESAWAARVGEMLAWLFPGERPTMTPAPAPGVRS